MSPLFAASTAHIFSKEKQKHTESTVLSVGNADTWQPKNVQEQTLPFPSQIHDRPSQWPRESKQEDGKINKIEKFRWMNNQVVKISCWQTFQTTGRPTLTSYSQSILKKSMTVWGSGPWVAIYALDPDTPCTQNTSSVSPIAGNNNFVLADLHRCLMLLNFWLVKESGRIATLWTYLDEISIDVVWVMFWCDESEFYSAVVN